MLTKYYDETLTAAHSLLLVDAAFFNQHHEEIGRRLSASSPADSIDESLDRLRATCYTVYVQLLRRRLPLTPVAVDLFRSALQATVSEVVASGRPSALTLVMEIANQLPWSDVARDNPQLAKFTKRCRRLLFESAPTNATTEHLSSILALWMTLAVK